MSLYLCAHVYIAGAEIFDGLTWLRYGYHDGLCIYTHNLGVVKYGLHVSDNLVRSRALTENSYALQLLRQRLLEFEETRSFDKLKPHEALLSDACDSLKTQFKGGSDGGSGGGYFSGSLTPDVLIKRIRQAEDEARDDKFETNGGEHLSSLLADFNNRDVEGTQELFDQIKADLENEIDGTIDTLFGGSISKHTYVDGISDVDALVLLNNSELADKSPNEVKSFLADCLRSRYGEAAVYEGVLAVTVSVQEKTIQLLPALRHGKGVKIARNDGRNWSKINPHGFAHALTKANQRLGGKLVPCIKLIKAIVATLPEKRRITGYHTESMAIKVFNAYDGPNTAKWGIYFTQVAPICCGPGFSPGQHTSPWTCTAPAPPRRLAGGGGRTACPGCAMSAD